jgi:hypothetical protein
MSIALELEGGGRKLGRVCDRSYRNGDNCPLILRESSEDLLTANVFGILRHLRPGIWLIPLMRAAFPHHRIDPVLNESVKLTLWKKIEPPPNRGAHEGLTEVDVHVTFDQQVLLVESKYTSAISTGTANDAQRDQIIRLLDVAHSSMVDGSLFPMSPFVLLIGSWPSEPELVTRYRSAGGVMGALPHLQSRADGEAIASYISKRVGYLSWFDLAKVLTARFEHATSLEAPFLVELAGYLRHKMGAAR